MKTFKGASVRYDKGKYCEALKGVWKGEEAKLWMLSKEYTACMMLFLYYFLDEFRITHTVAIKF
jgi:hypothetical protein